MTKVEREMSFVVFADFSKAQKFSCCVFEQWLSSAHSIEMKQDPHKFSVATFD